MQSPDESAHRSEDPVPRVRDVFESRLREKKERLEAARTEAAVLGMKVQDMDVIPADDLAERAELLAEINALSTAVEKLTRFLDPPPPPMSDTDVDAILAGMPSSKEFTELNKEFARALKRGKPGAKRTKLDLFMDVFDLMVQSQAMTYGRAIRELCHCGSAQAARLRNSVRVGIRDNLKPILREFAPELLKRFESLHPDRSL